MVGSPSRSWQLAALAAVLAGAALTVPARHLWEPDEARYAEVTREMLASGQLVVPILYGEPYPHKPPLYFWAQAALRAVGFGWTAAAVLPSLLALLAILLVLPRLAVALGMQRETGYLGSALLASSALAAALGLAGRMDMLLALFHTLALLSLARLLGLGRGEPAGRAIVHLAFWGCVALGVLTKGPVALALPALAAVAFRLLGGPGVTLKPVFRGLGPILFLALVLAWLVPAALRGGDAYVHDILVRQTADRIGTGSYTHPQPFYFHLITYPLTGLPWSPLVIVATWHALRRRERGPTFLAAAIVSLILLFSVVSGKLILYLLPMFPIAALLAAHHLATGGPARRAALLIGSLASVLVGIAVAIAPRWLPQVGRSGWLAVAAGVAVALPALAAVTSIAAGAPRIPGHAPLVAAGLAFAAISLPASVRLLDPYMSVSGVAATVVDREPLATDCLIYQDRYPGLALYSARQLTVLATPEELLAALARGRWVVVEERDWKKLPARVVAAVSGTRTIPHRRRTLLLVRGS